MHIDTLPVRSLRFHPEVKAYDENEPGSWHVIKLDGDTVGTEFHIVLASFPASFGAASALSTYARNNNRYVEDLRNHVAVSGGTIVHYGWLSWPWWSRVLNAKMPRYEVMCGGVSFGIHDAPSPRFALNEMCKARNLRHPSDWITPVNWRAELIDA